MAHKTPVVQRQQLFLPPHTDPLCTVDSPQWVAWLHTATHFRFCSTQCVPLIRGYGVPLAPISLRKEARRRGQFWYAYRRASRRLYKRYVGRSEYLTLDRLNQLAHQLHFCEDP